MIRLQRQSSSAIERILTRYLDQTSKSRSLWETAKEKLPSGSSRTSIFYAPYPCYAKTASGSRIVDEDGNERIDFCFNFTSLILGHQHPAVKKAVLSQLDKGTVFGAPTELEIEHAEAIEKRMPSLDKVRYTVTGTEACMFAIRLARAFTKRKMIAKFEGGYHGTSESASVSVHPPILETETKSAYLAPMPDTEGLPQETLENSIVLPFNNFEETESALRKNRAHLACIVIEPVMRGIAPLPGFLQSIRELADALDLVLIFDEVITGFRISMGGAQEKYSVKPDLTTMGKIIGGGFPVGAIGGREEIMSLMAHQGVEFPGLRGPRVPHAGTFNAHPIMLAAGIATMKELTPETYSKLDETGEQIRKGLVKIVSDLGIRAQITGIGSLFNVDFTDKQVIDYRSSHTADSTLRCCFDLDMLNRGVFLPPQHFGCTSTVTSYKDAKATLDEMSQSLQTLIPIIRERRPQLIA
jgi:glutamate-1-semialdehyde 2,1-aminomutase